MAKNQISMWRVRLVGFLDVTVSMVGLLSLYIGVGLFCSNLSSMSTDLIYFVVFAAVTTAINSASVLSLLQSPWL